MAPTQSQFARSLLLLCTIFTLSQGIFVNMTSTAPQCYFKNVKKDEYISGSFVVSGYNEENVVVGVRHFSLPYLR